MSQVPRRGLCRRMSTDTNYQPLFAAAASGKPGRTRPEKEAGTIGWLKLMRASRVLVPLQARLAMESILAVLGVRASAHPEFLCQTTQTCRTLRRTLSFRGALLRKTSQPIPWTNWSEGCFKENQPRTRTFAPPAGSGFCKSLRLNRCSRERYLLSHQAKR